MERWNCTAFTFRKVPLRLLVGIVNKNKIVQYQTQKFTIILSRSLFQNVMIFSLWTVSPTFSNSIDISDVIFLDFLSN